MFFSPKGHIKARIDLVPGINVVDYGALANDATAGSLNSRAFFNAIQAAALLRRPLYVPSGKYHIGEPLGGTTPQIEPTYVVSIMGDGANHTLIKFDPDLSQTAGFALRPGGKLILENLTLEGRTGSTNVFHHVFAYQGNGTVVKARRCRFTGATTPFKMDGMVYFLELVDCDFDVQGNAADGGFSVLATENGGSGGAVHFHNCTFRTGHHCMYINGGVSLLVDGSVFEQSGSEAYGIRIKQDSPTKPEYVVIRGCVFKEGSGRVQTSGQIRTLITDCTFVGKPEDISIQLEGGGVHLTGCRFTGEPQAQIDDWATAEGEVVAVNCRFEGAPILANIRRTRDSPAQWRFTDCDFRNNYDGDTYCILCVLGGNFELAGCKFEGMTDAPGNNGRYSRIAGGRFVMRGCHVQGNRSIFITAESRNVTVELWDNVFESSWLGSGLDIQPLGPGDGVVTVRGANNRFDQASRGPSVSLTGSPTARDRVKGWLKPPQQRGETFASANEISIYPSESFYHLTGTTTIGTIRVRGDSNPESIFHGPIRLIADSNPGFSLSDGGNIKPRTTAQRTLHEIVTLVFDTEANGGLGWWFEV